MALFPANKETKPIVVTENMTTSQYGYLTFPNNRVVINATVESYKHLLLLQYQNSVLAKYYCDSATGQTGQLTGSTQYSVVYSYLEQ